MFCSAHLFGMLLALHGARSVDLFGLSEALPSAASSLLRRLLRLPQRRP